MDEQSTKREFEVNRFEKVNKQRSYSGIFINLRAQLTNMKTSEKAITFAAIFVSALALFVSVYQTIIMQRSQHAEVWPYIEIGQSFSPEHYEIQVKNKGIGPAKIKDVTYRIADKKFNKIHDAVDYFYELDNVPDSNSSYQYSNISGGRHVILSGEKAIIYRTTDSLVIRNIIKKTPNRLLIEVKYCSVYDECWTINFP